MKINQSESTILIIQQAVLKWYSQNGRHDLPWRNLNNYSVDIPYGVLISEIMLQQTQVDRVKPKFISFITRFPTIFDLASANASEVITLWSGLGYNRRAVMLHDVAETIVQQYKGKVPDREADLLHLSGIGPYTARAVLAFGYNQPIVVVDTNIKRFYELLIFGYSQPTDKEIIEAAEQFIPEEQSREWHAALMDFMTHIRKVRTPAEQQQVLIETLSIYIPHLPALSQAPFKRSKQSPFIGSFRFYRGQLVDLLRQAPKNSMTLEQLDIILKLPSKYKLEDIITTLKKDKLITYGEPLTFDTDIYLGNALNPLPR